MFRGGRVDSRGTGIASGLSYQKGGRVGYDVGGSTNPRFVNLGGGSTKTGQSVMDAATSKWGRATNLVKNPNFSERGLYEAAKKYGPKAFNWGKSGITGILSRFPGLAQLGAYYGLATPTPVDEKYGITRMDNLLPMFGDTEEILMKKSKRNLEESANPNNPWRYDFWTHGSAKDHPDYDPEKRSWWPWAEGAAATGEEETVEEEINPELAAALAKIKERDALIKLMEEQALVKKNKKLSKEEKVAKIKENEEMFREVYGSGRGEDASRMLLSAASRLLEPEATVKSGLSKFLGDESKVESKRSKYKDAAAQAAITSFLTGEKTMAEVDAYMSKSLAAERNKYKVAQEYSSSMPWSARRDEKGEKFATDTKFFKSKLPKYLSDIKQPYTSIEFADEEDVKITGDKAQENLNKVFVDVDSDVFFIVEMGPDGKIRKRYLQNILG